MVNTVPETTVKINTAKSRCFFLFFVSHDEVITVRCQCRENAAHYIPKAVQNIVLKVKLGIIDLIHLI